ncbi:MAG: hypothetical protein KAX19_08115, partial [Candidatus Brocadiae bacterium]|nr:hypothetical protein [Candidatus Brocadiia bacterium]
LTVALLCLLLGFAGCAVGEPTLRLADYLPPEINGWRAEGKDGFYDRTNLFDYINGAAEPYLHYGFRRLAARRLVREGQPAILVDLFDMGTSQNAFGIFSFEREGDDVGMGQGSEYETGFMRFWKGRFFVSILAEGETPEAEAAVFGLGKAIDIAIAETGPEPDLVRQLPTEGIGRRRVRYFRHHGLLNYHYYVADENILCLGQRTEAVLAPYATPQGRLHLLLVRYPAAGEAEAALAEFLRAYAPEATGGAARTENRKWVVAQGLGALVAVVFDAPSEEHARALIRSVRARRGEDGT